MISTPASVAGILTTTDLHPRLTGFLTTPDLDPRLSGRLPLSTGRAATALQAIYRGKHARATLLLVHPTAAFLVGEKVRKGKRARQGGASKSKSWLREDGGLEIEIASPPPIGRLERMRERLEAASLERKEAHIERSGGAFGGGSGGVQGTVAGFLGGDYGLEELLPSGKTELSTKT